MKIRARIAKWPPLQLPVVRYGLIGLAIALWGFGLVGQFGSAAAITKYLLISLIIVALAAF